MPITELGHAACRERKVSFLQVRIIIFADLYNNEQLLITNNK